jgi:hypothetical protein
MKNSKAGSLLGRLLREPLVHFLGLALVILTVYWAVGPRQDDSDTVIVVSPNRIEQLSAVFARTWQRPPTAQELKSLIDDFVKEEIYVREARKLGLDADDTVIRRRLRLKMEFLSDAEAELAPPTEAELAAYLETHAAKFARPPLYSFDQVNFSSDRGASAEADARKLLVALNGEAPPDPRTVGDATLLPPSLDGVDAAAAARTFGEGFAEALPSLPLGVWSGPVTSSYGVHVVRVRARKEGAASSLADVRDQVQREWMHERKQQLEEQRLKSYLERYSVQLPLPGEASP